MANKKCKSCAMDIPKEAKVCPYCRKTQGLTNCAVMGILLVGLLVIGGIIGITLGPNHNAKVSDDELPKLAFYRAQREMSAYLKAPATADFAYYDEASVKRLVNDSRGVMFEVKSYVDAQNSFGAKLRTNFKVVIIRDKRNNGWVLASIEKL